MRDEQIAILKMLQDHTISREDAQKLLDAIGTARSDGAVVASLLQQVENGELTPEQGCDQLNGRLPEVVQTGSVRGHKIRIHVEKSGKSAVNIRVPLSLVETGLRLFGQESIRVDGKPIDTVALLDTLRSGQIGTILEIDGDDGEHVEISVE